MMVPPPLDEPRFGGGAALRSRSVFVMREAPTTSSARRQLPWPNEGVDSVPNVEEPVGNGWAIDSGAAPRTIGRSVSATRSNDTGRTFVPLVAMAVGRPRVAMGAVPASAWGAGDVGVAGWETAMAIRATGLTAGAVAPVPVVELQAVS